MAHATFRERPPRTNAPMQPRNGEKKMELVECQTCGSHSITNGKCDYCGNKYESVSENKLIYGNSIEDDSLLTFPELDEETTFEDTKTGKLILKIMIYTLVSIVWLAVTVFIPPLFIITIILLVVYGIFLLTKRMK